MDFTTEYSLDIDENDHARNILKKLDSMRRKQANCDLIISVEGKTLHVNRDVMCAASDYFDAMFSHDTKEKQEGLVEMKDVKFSAVEKCINFIYSGKISVSEDECEGLLYSASLMQLNQICEKVSPFLEDRLNPKSFFNIRRIAVKFSLKTLNAVCDEFAVEKLFELAEEREFKDLDIDLLSFALTSKKSIGERTEDSKLSIGLQWIKVDPKNREKHLMKIVESLDMSKLTSGYGRFLVENEPLCIKFPDFMKEIFLGMANFHQVKITGHPNQSWMSSLTEVTCPNSFFIFDQSLKVMQLYQPSENKLMRMNAYHSEMNHCFTACMLKGHLYVFNINKKAFCLNTSEKKSTWTRVADMLHNHELGMQCTVHENDIYVGGNNKLERYKTGEWEDVVIDEYFCDRSALVSYRRCVFVIGGKCSSSVNTVDHVRKFSPLSSSWTSVTSMNIARQDASATVFNGKIYVAGGWSGWSKGTLRDFEMYDNVSDLWTILPKMNSPRSFFGLQLVDDQIFAVGNFMENCTIEVYDSKNEKWIPHHNGPKMNIRAAATVAVYIPSK